MLTHVVKKPKWTVKHGVASLYRFFNDLPVVTAVIATCQSDKWKARLRKFWGQAGNLRKICLRGITVIVSLYS